MRFQGIWAVARNTIAQAIRVRVGFALMALYLALVIGLPFFVQGDGTLRGQLHVLINFSLIVAGTLLAILTLALSTTTLWSEIRDKQIYLLEARPIRRWQVLLGKFLGLLAINAALLLFMGIVTWGSVQWISRQKRWGERDVLLANEQVLTARRTLRPEPPPESQVQAFVDQSIDNRVRQLERQERMPEGGREAVREQIREEFFKLINAVPVRLGRHWEFAGLHIPRRKETRFTLRFKFFSSDRKSEEPVRVHWEYGVPRQTASYRHDGAFMPDVEHEVQVPADAIAQDGTFEVRFLNFDPRGATLMFPETDGIVALIPVGGFGVNLARGLGVIFVEVSFLAALGLFCSTFLSFPVSPIVALSLLLQIYLAGSVNAEFERGFTFDQTKQSKTALAAETFTRVVAKAVRVLLPPFDRYSPSALVSSGEEVSWGLLLEAVGLIALLYGGVLTFLGTVIFERREIALATR